MAAHVARATHHMLNVGGCAVGRGCDGTLVGKQDMFAQRERRRRRKRRRRRVASRTRGRGWSGMPCTESRRRGGKALVFGETHEATEFEASTLGADERRGDVALAFETLARGAGVRFREPRLSTRSSRLRPGSQVRFPHRTFPYGASTLSLRRTRQKRRRRERGRGGGRRRRGGRGRGRGRGTRP